MTTDNNKKFKIPSAIFKESVFAANHMEQCGRNAKTEKKYRLQKEGKTMYMYSCRFQQHSLVTFLWAGSRKLKDGRRKEGMRGLCFAFCVMWMQCIAEKKNYFDKYSEKKFMSRSKADEYSKLVADLQDQQHNFEDVNTATIAILRKEVNLKPKKKEFKQFSGWEKDTYRELAKHLFQTKGRFYMLLIKKHAMAAYCDSSTSVKFFDPNGGEVTATTVDCLAHLFREYFGRFSSSENGAYKGSYKLMQKYCMSWDNEDYNKKYVLAERSMPVRVLAFQKCIF